MLLQHPFLVAAFAAVLATLVSTALIVHKVGARGRMLLRAITDGLNSLRDRDFSISIAADRKDEFGELIGAYNSLGAVLRSERQSLYQRELLLDTVIQSTPLALVLTNTGGAIVYSNLAARQLLLAGRKLEGFSFNAILENAPEQLREAVAGGQDTLFTMMVGQDAEIFHLSLRRFVLNAQAHHLYLLKKLTRELNAQEVATWKKVIRVIAHELNNSLAPISSLAHSGQLLLERHDEAQMHRVFNTIAERAAHLHAFIDGYAHFAKLPRPRIASVQWREFLQRLSDTVDFADDSTAPERSCFDAAQMEQVLINLIKNSHESGSPPDQVRLDVRVQAPGILIQVQDRGGGMSTAVLQQALLPFYSTKPAGTGLGLTVCREIVEAHGGRMHLSNREGGGLMVSLWLPDVVAGVND
jgi:nitrogen fixation/metabolism regulation signal transduction histidine kinase